MSYVGHGNALPVPSGQSLATQFEPLEMAVHSEPFQEKDSQTTTDMDDGVCVYCGAPATDRDHVVPRAYVRSTGNAVKPTDVAFGETVPSCRECNTILGKDAPHTVPQRRSFVEQRLRKKYRRLLQSPDWTQAEIDDLSPSLREAVQASQDHKRRIKERLRWASGSSYKIRLARLRTPESLENAAKTVAARQEFVREDVLLLRGRGMVPLAIADEVGVSLRRVVEILNAAGLTVPRYLTTFGEPKKSPDDVCELRRALNG